MAIIKCRVEPLSQKYVDGLERVELYPNSEQDVCHVPKPKPKQRLGIIFSTRHGDYEGGLRTYQGRWPFVCPNFTAPKTSLARVLRDAGVVSGQIVDVEVIGNRWKLL